MSTASIHTKYLFKRSPADLARHCAVSIHCTIYLMRALKKKNENPLQLAQFPVFQLMLALFAKLSTKETEIGQSYKRFQESWDGKTTIKLEGSFSPNLREKLEFYCLEVSHLVFR